MGLTNQHVLVVNGNFSKGQSVGQTSADEYSICSRCCSEIIGVILDGVNDADVDVGLINLNGKLNYYNQIEDEPTNFPITGSYSLQTSGIPVSPFHVKKRGATSRLTTGTVDAINFSTNAGTSITYTNLISIRPDSGLFQDEGDSGAVLVSNETAAQAQPQAGQGKVIGLMFAANLTSGFGFAFDIDVVKSKLAGINLPINILASTTLNNKQTVPNTNAQANAYLARPQHRGTIPARDCHGGPGVSESSKRTSAN